MNVALFFKLLNLQLFGAVFHLRGTTETIKSAKKLYNRYLDLLAQLGQCLDFDQVKSLIQLIYSVLLWPSSTSQNDLHQGYSIGGPRSESRHFEY